MEDRPNWRALAGSVQTLSTILAGFSFTLLVLALGRDVLTLPLNIPFQTDTKVVALFGLALAGVLLVISTECLLHSQSYDVWSLSSERFAALKMQVDDQGWKWSNWLADYDAQTSRWYRSGVYLYYVGVLLFLAGGAFLIYPYSMLTSLGIFGSGFALELGWIFFLVRER